MKAHLSYQWERLSSSYWFVPTLVLGGVVGALLRHSHHRPPRRDEVPDRARVVKDMGVDGARLFTFASSMIAMAGIVFSIHDRRAHPGGESIRPRILRSFLRDQGNQMVLGIATESSGR